MNLKKLVASGRQIRVLGIDDAHFKRERGTSVNVAGIVCSLTRFEGMLWGELEKDGLDATERLCDLVTGSKFAPQLHVVLLDGITFGGCNIVELPKLWEAFGVPVVAVMRQPPDLTQFRQVVDRLPNAEERWRRVLAAGPIHQLENWVFQCVGEVPEVVAKTLDRLTDRGNVPESLRIAHLIGSAVKLGQSTNSA